MHDYDRRTAKEIPQKRSRPTGAFYGDDDGSWEYSETYRLGHTSDWEATMSLASHNGWRNLMVEGATEYHEGFLKALKEMIREYPELRSFEIKFDGPWIPVATLLKDEPTFDWSGVEFYHGTSSTAWGHIAREGMRPRSITNVAPVYGVSAVGAGRVNAVYLTTQLSMAKFAALEAGKAHKGTPVILQVRGIDGEHVLADEDSRETDPKKSLDRIGSIAYAATIPPSKVRLVFELRNNSWVRV